MSSEHSASEDEEEESSAASDDDAAPKRKVLCRRPLPWRSEELNGVFKRLDRKTMRKQSQRSSSMMIRRIDGPPSTRKAPAEAPQFAVS